MGLEKFMNWNVNCPSGIQCPKLFQAFQSLLVYQTFFFFLLFRLLQFTVMIFNLPLLLFDLCISFSVVSMCSISSSYSVSNKLSSKFRNGFSLSVR